ncbi:helix-turn-helix domain-containing protein [Streptomyces prunicolor]|uniref:helix-turn-helix domain-containing protein n=1 Tax=Streptomyces prunicolor TaxID=67348 RepID=UPI00039B285E|nr:helix-turn-helix domain-containing protein [Streptomyces prunicolor]
MSRVDPAKRVDAILPLVAGQSQRAVAESVGVHPSTIRAWLKDPVFVRELDLVRELAARKPLDAEAILVAMDEVQARLCGSGPVTVVIPPGASPRRRRKLLAGGIAQALERAEGGAR